MRVAAVSGLGLLAFGCAPTSPPATTPVAQRCDAETTGRQLIGSHVGAVDFVAGANVRIVCKTCSTTKDLRPDRLNIRFDQATGIIQSVDCG